MKIKVVNLAIILLTFVATLVAMVFLPDIIPVHFDINGAVDRWGSEYELLLLPVVLLLMSILSEKSIGFFALKTKGSDDEKLKSDAVNNEKAVGKVLTGIYAIMALVNLGIIYMTFSNLESYNLPEIDIVKIVVILVGVMMIFTGNFMPKTRMNSLVGLRTPWSMYNDNTWRKSNLFAGFVMMIFGVLVCVEALIFEGFLAGIIMLLMMIISSAILTVYTYLVYRREKNSDLSQK